MLGAQPGPNIYIVMIEIAGKSNLLRE